MDEKQEEATIKELLRLAIAMGGAFECKLTARTLHFLCWVANIFALLALCSGGVKALPYEEQLPQEDPSPVKADR